MWAEKKVFCKKRSFHHVMLKDKCSSEQQNPVYKENGVTYDARPAYPDRDEVTEPMGPGYPRVIQGAPQMESSLNNPSIASTHADVASVVIDSMVSLPERSAQDEWSKNLDRPSWDNIPDRIPRFLNILLLFPGERLTVLAGPIPPMWPLLSLLTMLRHFY